MGFANVRAGTRVLTSNQLRTSATHNGARPVLSMRTRTSLPPLRGMLTAMRSLPQLCDQPKSTPSSTASKRAAVSEPCASRADSVDCAEAASAASSLANAAWSSHSRQLAGRAPRR